MKALYKKMMLSATYRQSSVMRPDLLRRDSGNRLLARGPRFRLDAETIRDQALFVSGLLVDRVGGPSVKPYQPAGLWKTIGYSGSNTVEFHQSHGDSLYRRSLYTFWKRTSHPPNMAAFDAPNRESCTVRRERTNTPLQALVLMNDPQFVEASRHFAERVLKEEGGKPLDRMFRMVVGRPATKEERKIVAGSLKSFRETYSGDEEAAHALVAAGESSCVEGIEMAELAAWTMLANQLLNLDEVINKN